MKTPGEVVVKVTLKECACPSIVDATSFIFPKIKTAPIKTNTIPVIKPRYFIHNRDITLVFTKSKCRSIVEYSSKIFKFVTLFVDELKLLFTISSFILSNIICRIFAAIS